MAGVLALTMTSRGERTTGVGDFGLGEGHLLDVLLELQQLAAGPSTRVMARAPPVCARQEEAASTTAHSN